MDKQTIERDMRESVKGKGFINQSQLAKYMGCGRDSVRIMIKDLDFLQTGKEKKYLIRDVAGKIMEEKQNGKRMVI